MSLKAYAATETYTSLMNNATEVKFNNYDWYIIEDDSTSATEGTVTLLAADDSFGYSKFSDESSNAYSSSKIKTALDSLTKTGAFKDVANAIVDMDLSDVSVTGAKLYLLDKATAQAVRLNLPLSISYYEFPNAEMGAWWLRTRGYQDCNADLACKEGVGDFGFNVDKSLGIRPALRLDLSSVTFSPESNTFTLNGGEKPAATVTKAPTAKSLSYTGQAQELVNAGTAEGGTIQYAPGTKEKATGEYTASIPKETNAGTYYVWYKAKGDDKHTDSEAACVTVTISKDDPEPGPDPKPEPKPEPKKKDKKSSSSSESSTPPNPNALNIIYIKNGTRVWEAKASKQVQGPAAQLAFKQIMSPGCNEAFSFNLIADGKAIDHTLKNGKLILFIPDGYRKAGRVFALTAIDKNGKVHFYPDTDSDPATVTVDVNFEGYAFDLIYIG